ncbi:MAG: hypothetical protein LBV71_19210 [Prevotella sp.]|nr:hypothetical protein [Prevotella sp.]
MRSAFKPLFSKEYNPKVRLFYHGIEGGPKKCFFSYSEHFPFIKKLGALKLHISGQASRETWGQDGRHHFFQEEKKIKHGDSKICFGRIPAIEEYAGYRDVAEDQRFSFMCYSLDKPLYLSAHYKSKYASKEICVATARIFIHVYSSGFVAISVAVNPQKGEFYKSLDDFLGKFDSNYINPWDEHSEFSYWKSRVANGSLGKIVKTVVSLLSDSIFENESFVEESKLSKSAKGGWHKSIMLHCDEPAETIISRFNLKNPIKIGELCKFVFEAEEWRKKQGYEDEQGDWGMCNRMPEKDKSFNYYLFDKDIDLLNYSGRLRNTFVRHRFWLSHGILEKTMIQKAILELYAKHFREEISNLQKWQLSKDAQLIEGRFLQLSVFHKTIYEHIKYLKSFVRDMIPFERNLHSKYGETIGLNKIFEDIDTLLPLWMEECRVYKALGIRYVDDVISCCEKIKKVIPLLSLL